MKRALLGVLIAGFLLFCLSGVGVRLLQKKKMYSIRTRNQTLATSVSERSRYLLGMFNRTQRFQFPIFPVSASRHVVVEGWVENDAAFVTHALGMEQLHRRIFGSIAEIGVHHGLFTSTLITIALEDEPVFVVDVFDHQNDNIDRSGFGSFEHLTNTLSYFGWRSVLASATQNIPEWKPRTVTSFRAKSSEVNVDMLKEHFPLVRLMSVDGGHYVDAVMHDMKMAEGLLVDGGLVIVDDFPNMLQWPGVHDGVSRYFHTTKNSRLAPFFVIGNKLFITTTSHHQHYLSFLKSMPELRRCKGGHSGGTRDDIRFQLYGFAIAYGMNCNIGRQLWSEMLCRSPIASCSKSKII